MSVAYNEIDPYAVEYMRWLMAADLIAPGHIFTCSIEDLTPRDLQPFTQFHAFAGMGVWSYAARAAGVRDDTNLWTGSCPCQPFSAAGKGGGFADERHLWPAFLHLINAVRPERVVGEQVAGKDGLAWFDLVSSDLESHGYAGRAVPLCSAGFGSPDIRNRLYWCADRMADHQSDGRGQGRSDGGRRGAGDRAQGRTPGSSWGCHAGGLADAFAPERSSAHPSQCDTGEPGGWLEDPGAAAGCGEPGGPRPLNGVWRNADWLFCRDGKWRPVEPGAFPLVTGAPGRVGRIRATGNAINAQVAIEFLKAIVAEDAGR